MKQPSIIYSILIGASVVGMITAQTSFGQNSLRVIGVSPTDEQAIRLTWVSTNHELYQIQCANALNTNAGSTAWQTLYDNYPSQGTNTSWLDTGNYNVAPQILHPKYAPMRFYRLMDEGSDSLASDEPSVSVTAPTNGAVVSGELTVIAVVATDHPVLGGTTLYVDGQEMQMADSTTNYTIGSTNYEADTYSINTCEWGNEPHTLFATAQCQSGYGDAVNSPPVMTGHGVSAPVSVNFDNLVTRISFSQPSFNPGAGQTQQVSAVFPLNSDWTLTVVDVYSNVVQTASGSGMSMLYNWDGTDNGTNLPNGIYFYYITAQTNGQPNDVGGGDSGGGGGGGPPMPDSPELWAMPSDGGEFVPLAIYPPGFDTNSLTIVTASSTQISALLSAARPASSRVNSATTMDNSGGVSPDYNGVTPLPSPQPAPPAPQRPPNNPVKGLAGTFGVAVETYTGNGTNGYTLSPIDNGLGIGQDISMDGNSPGMSLTYPPLAPHQDEANGFVEQMQKWGWQSEIFEMDNQLSVNDLKYSNSKFNSVNLAVLLSHGAYGTGVYGIDYQANGAKQMYFPIGGQYLRMSDMNLGGSGTNGLKWFLATGCDSMHQANWQSMQSKGVQPYNGNLHLFLGLNSTNYTSETLLGRWAQYMNYGTRNNYGSPLTIRAAWYQAGHDAFQYFSLPPGTKLVYAVAGDNACYNDMVATNSIPQGGWFYESQQVYPPQ